MQSEKQNNKDLFADIKKLQKFTGKVIEALANCQFKVEIDFDGTKRIVRCYLNGKMRKNKIKILINDSVELELPRSAHLENSIGRITYRNNV